MVETYEIPSNIVLSASLSRIAIYEGSAKSFVHSTIKSPTSTKLACNVYFRKVQFITNVLISNKCICDLYKLLKNFKR